MMKFFLSWKFNLAIVVVTNLIKKSNGETPPSLRKLTLYNIFKATGSNFVNVPRPSLTPSKVPSLMPSSSPTEVSSLMPSLYPSNIPSWSPSDVPSLMPSTYPTYPAFNPSFRTSFEIESSPFEIYLSRLKIPSNSTIPERAESTASLIIPQIDDLLVSQVFPRKNGVSASFVTNMIYEYFLESEEFTNQEIHSIRNVTGYNITNITNAPVYDRPDGNMTEFSMSIQMKKSMKVTYVKTKNDSFFDRIDALGTEFLDEAIKVFFNSDYEVGRLKLFLVDADPIINDIRTIEYRGLVTVASRETDLLENSNTEHKKPRDHTVFISIMSAIFFIFSTAFIYYVSKRKRRSLGSHDKKLQDSDSAKPLTFFKLRRLNKRLESPFIPYLGGSAPSKEDEYYFKRASETDASVLLKYAHIQSWLVTMGNTIGPPLDFKQSDSNVTYNLSARNKKKFTGPRISLDAILDVDEDEDSEEEVETAERYKRKRMRQLNHWRKCEEIYTRTPPGGKSERKRVSRSSSSSDIRSSSSSDVDSDKRFNNRIDVRPRSYQGPRRPRRAMSDDFSLMDMSVMREHPRNHDGYRH